DAAYAGRSPSAYVCSSTRRGSICLVGAGLLRPSLPRWIWSSAERILRDAAQWRAAEQDPVGELRPALRDRNAVASSDDAGTGPGRRVAAEYSPGTMALGADWVSRLYCFQLESLILGGGCVRSRSLRRRLPRRGARRPKL